VRRFATFYAALREMTTWLVAEGVTHVAMESTGVYWMPVFHALAEPDAVEIVLCNAHHVKNAPGRKTDVKDAQWLAQLMEVGLLRGSFIPPPQIAVIRQLCRYRHPGRGTHPGRSAAAQGAGRRRDQAGLGGLRRTRRVRPLGDPGVDRRRTQSRRVGRPGPPTSQAVISRNAA
jgi:transposase